MDQRKKQNNPIFSRINSSNKALLILLSLSVLAIIASQYSSFLSYLSSIKLLSFSTIDRHCIFLICNGLMLLVIKTSGLFALPTPPGTEFYRESHVIRHHVQLSHHQSANFHDNIHVKNNVVFDQSTESNNEKNVRLQSDDLPEAKAETKVVTEVEEPTIGITEMDQGGQYVTCTAEYDEKEVINDLLDDQQEHEEEEEEEEQEIMLWTTEELNRKCDDFIRKMKYCIKNEAPLVMV